MPIQFGNSETVQIDVFCLQIYWLTKSSDKFQAKLSSLTVSPRPRNQ